MSYEEESVVIVLIDNHGSEVSADGSVFGSDRNGDDVFSSYKVVATIDVNVSSFPVWSGSDIHAGCTVGHADWRTCVVDAIDRELKQ